MLEDKDLRQQLLNEVHDDSIPNMATRIKQQHINHQKAKAPKWKKGLAWGIPMGLLACGIAVAVIVPNVTGNDTNKNIVDIYGLGIHGKKNEIAFGILSANNLFSDTGLEPNSLMPRAKLDISENDFKTQMEYLNPYMLTAEQMLDSKFDLKPVVEDYNIDGYQYKMKISAPDEEDIYFIYKEVLEVEEKDVLVPLQSDDEDDDEEVENEEDKELEEDDELDSEDDEKEEEDDEMEQEYRIEGYFDKNGVRHTVVGEKELEVEEDEQEYELELKISQDANNYIIIKQEIETEDHVKEQSYVYTKFENGIKTLTADLSFEGDEDDTVVDVEISKDKQLYNYKISKDSDLAFTSSYLSKDHEGTINIKIADKIENDPNSGTDYIYHETRLNYETRLTRSKPLA